MRQQPIYTLQRFLGGVLPGSAFGLYIACCAGAFATLGCSPAKPALSAQPHTTPACNETPSTRDASPIVAVLMGKGTRLPGVTVKWHDANITVSNAMYLKRGDIVETTENTKVSLKFLESGADVVLMPNTCVQIGSLSQWWGELFVSGPLSLFTKDATIAHEGTTYAVKVERETQETTVAVLDGKIRVTPEHHDFPDFEHKESQSSASWSVVSLGGGENKQEQVVLKQNQEGMPSVTEIPRVTREQWTLELAKREGTPEINKLIADKIAHPEQAGAKDGAVWMPDLIGATVAEARKSLDLPSLGRGKLQLVIAAEWEKLLQHAAPTARIVSQFPLPNDGVGVNSEVCIVAANPAGQTCAGWRPSAKAVQQ